MNPTEPKKRKVSEWGLPTEDDSSVMVEWSDGTVSSYRFNLPYPSARVVAWWPLTIPTEYEPPPRPPAPDGWRHMDELPDGHGELVWFAYEDGSVTAFPLSLRRDDADAGRLWWRPIEPPAHPGVGR